MGRIEKTIEYAKQLRLSCRRPPRPKYGYPAGVCTISVLNTLARYGIGYAEDHVHFTRALDSQRKLKKGIYGAGLLVPEERLAQALARSRQVQSQRERDNGVITWELSEREREIIRELNAAAEANEEGSPDGEGSPDAGG